MLQNMRHAGAVGRRRPKADEKHLVVIVRIHQKHFCAALFMLKNIPDGI